MTARSQTRTTEQKIIAQCMVVSTETSNLQRDVYGEISIMFEQTKTVQSLNEEMKEFVVSTTKINCFRLYHQIKKK